jgi:hypothetical protein
MSGIGVDVTDNAGPDVALGEADGVGAAVGTGGTVMSAIGVGAGSSPSGLALG